MKKVFIILAMALQLNVYAQTKENPLKIGIAGLSHGHVHWILRSAQQGIVEVVGVAETNKALAERLLRQYGLPVEILYSDLNKMLDEKRPEAVTAFGSIYDHLSVVQSCAPRKIHVMVEKPLAVSLDHARQIEKLARQHSIHVLTNYETTWYGSHHRAFEMINQGQIGGVVKIVVHDGHQGPEEIGVNKEFLEWLTDPVKNGGGALMDFGCYGADLITWIMKGERPAEISAVTQQLKPDKYPKVDDEATIILKYQNAQGIIQASWNWPYNRKDIEIYGRSGFIFADREGMMYGNEHPNSGTSEKVSPPESPFHDPFTYLTAVVRGDVNSKKDLSSLEVNMIAMEILEAAKMSARTGTVVKLPLR